MRMSKQGVGATVMLACVLAAGSIAFSADPPKKPDAVTTDGGRYYGPLADGRLQGRGRLEWDNGDYYEGNFADGRFSGKGRYKWANGIDYEGEFADGRFSGKGRMQLWDGSVYTGDFRHGTFQGKGRLDSPGTYTYEGEFQQGNFHGQGHITQKGADYRGGFERGRYSGFGIATMADGSKYKGQFAQNFWEGKGRFENAAGEVYEGDFSGGTFTGRGKLTRPDGGTYEGDFTNWMFNGAGKLSDPRLGSWEGKFVNGSLNGKGKYAGKDGQSFDGNFKNWLYDGQGELHLANGDAYRGNFKDGLYSGPGTLTYAKPVDGKTQATGIWEYGQLGAERQQNFEANVEVALYNQRSLLDDTFASLAPPEPGKINLYMLAVAGHGAQEVFRREVEFVNKQFAGRFDTEKRTVALVNSRSTVATVPMATVTSIGESIKAIAARMDREKDILFIYLSSHGSKDHRLSLDQNGMDLPDLSAKELSAMLRESGIRWKVLVVSACYAGGFIRPIKDDYTLIIAAARDDRRSFGCGDDNDFTYFGEAFFRDALPQSTSFPEAFEKARLLVEKREVADQRPGEKVDRESLSMPQIHNPAKIDQHLRKWWAQAAR